MDIAPTVLLATLIWQVIDFVRELTNLPTQRSAVVTQASAWLGGVVTVVLASHSAMFDHFSVNGLTLTQLDGGSQVFLGLVVSSLASSLVDVKQAFDGRDSSAKPPLIPSPALPVAEEPPPEAKPVTTRRRKAAQ